MHDLSDDNAMRVALAQAATGAAMGEVPVGAVVLHEGKIIAAAHNLRETTHDPLAHAEILALRAAAQALGRWRLSGCTLVVTLEPCPMCAGAVVNSRIDRLVYGARDPRAGAVGSLMDVVRDPRLNHRAEVLSGVAEVEAGTLLSNFFAHRRAAKRAQRGAVLDAISGQKGACDLESVTLHQGPLIGAMAELVEGA